jgi:hypothetical protein
MLFVEKANPLHPKQLPEGQHRSRPVNTGAASLS